MITGIVAEFNPFHNGHAYLLKQAKGIKIIAMSGNFMQRGEPAFVDKWTRAQMALENGADLIVELPFLVSVQGADQFAAGAVAILHRCGVDNLVFGTEEQTDYQQVAQIYVDKKSEMENFIKNLPDYLSYPQKSQLMWEKFANLQFNRDTPNHVLALAYAKAVADKGIRLNPVLRKGESFHSLEKNVYASATALRQHSHDLEFIKMTTPAAQLLLSTPQVSWSNYFDLLRYQILTHPDLTQIYQVNLEMASRIKQNLPKASSVEDLVEKVATKRYTKARVRRLLTYILVNASEHKLPETIHVLGFSQKGQDYLKQLKKKTSLITRIGKEEWDGLTQKADAIYQLGNVNISNQNFGRIPIMPNNNI